MKRGVIIGLLVAGLALPVCAQKLNVDPAHPYSSSEQKQADKLYKKSLKKQEKAAKKDEKANKKAWKKQQKEANRVNKERQKQIEQGHRY